MEILVIAIFGLNVVLSTHNAIKEKGYYKLGWISSALGWTCAIIGYAGYYGWIG